MTRPNALPWLSPAPPIPVGTYIPVHIPLDVCSTELVLVRKERDAATRDTAPTLCRGSPLHPLIQYVRMYIPVHIPLADVAYTVPN